MNDARKRAVFRWVHIVFDIPIVGYVHSPSKQLPNYAPAVGYIASCNCAFRIMDVGKAT
jgi:hypothetical protein